MLPVFRASRAPMNTIKVIAWIFVIVYGVVVILLYTLQVRLIFYPGRLDPDFKFRLGEDDDEVYYRTADGELINALFFEGRSRNVVLYFHGNAGDLSGWQFVAEDFTSHGFKVMVIDYRGYGKSSGGISEEGFYLDGAGAYQYLVEKGFKPENIIVYGRSIGSGVAVQVASKYPCKGLILEAPFASLKKLADEKLPFFFPSLYLKFPFDNLAKINKVKCPVIFLHGTNDTLIPPSHSSSLFKHFTGKKEMILVEGASHNDLHTFPRYADFLKDVLPVFF